MWPYFQEHILCHGTFNESNQKGTNAVEPFTLYYCFYLSFLFFLLLPLDSELVCEIENLLRKTIIIFFFNQPCHWLTMSFVNNSSWVNACLSEAALLFGFVLNLSPINVQDYMLMIIKELFCGKWGKHKKKKN